jgi:hypothetical protein
MIWIVALFKLLYKKMVPKDAIIRLERFRTAIGLVWLKYFLPDLLAYEKLTPTFL